jgi:hypothetical protein
MLPAQHTTTGSANSGMDMTMPGSDFTPGGKTNVFWGPQLQSAINNRQVQQSRLDDMVKRVLAAWYLLGQDQGYAKQFSLLFRFSQYHSEVLYFGVRRALTSM